MGMRAREIGIVAELRLRVGIFAILVVVAATLCFLYLRFPEKRENLKFVAATVAGVTAVYSAYYAGLSLRQNIRLTKMRNAYELLDHIHRNESMDARALVEKFDTTAVQPRELVETILRDKELHKAVKLLLNAFEAIAIGVRSGFADEEVVFLNIASLAPAVFRAFYPYVEHMRARYGGDITVLREIEVLIQAWDQQRFLTTGKKIEVNVT
jgi:hypothetical protein